MELHTEPAADTGQRDGESLRVAGGVGGVVDGTGEACRAVSQRRLHRDQLFGIENLLMPAVVAKQY
jgi:hypothetical protein